MDGGLYRSWGANVRAAREATGWGIKALALIVDISPGALSNIELGRRCPRDEIKYRIAGALHVKPAELFPWPDEIPPFPSGRRTK